MSFIRDAGKPERQSKAAKPPAFIDCYGLIEERLSDSMHQAIPDIEIYRGETRDEDDIIARMQGRGHVLVYMAPLSERVLRSCPELKTVAYLSTGLATHADLAAARRLGIIIEGVKGYGDRAVAEHAITLALAGLKRIAFMDRRVRRGEWSLTPSEEIAGKTVGILGLGGIGFETARIAHALGANVLGWSRSVSSEGPQETRRAGFDEVLSASDILSLHLALTPQTTNIIDRRALALMKPGVVLVNTARGALIEKAALMDALAGGRIGHLALDVFHAEPPSRSDPLLSAENVTLTSHSAWLTSAAVDRLLVAGLQTLKRHIAASRGDRQ